MTTEPREPFPQSAASAPSPAAPSAALTHRVAMFGATIQFSQDHSRAIVTLPGGDVQEFVSAVEPSGFAQARDAAKADMKRRDAEESAARDQKIKRSVEAARKKAEGK